MQKKRNKNAQNSVLRAVSRGYRYADAIVEITGIPQPQVYTHLRRLIAKGLVECYRCSHDGGHKAYAIKTIEVLMLEKVWTRHPNNFDTGVR